MGAREYVVGFRPKAEKPRQVGLECRVGGGQPCPPRCPTHCPPLPRCLALGWRWTSRRLRSYLAVQFGTLGKRSCRKACRTTVPDRPANSPFSTTRSFAGSCN